MKKLPALIFVLICMVCYAGRGNLSNELSHLEQRLEYNPDSVLNVLYSIDRDRLHTRSLRADYSLLLSNALDKNYIDIASDSVIEPAVLWFSKRGAPEKRLKTFYYRGLISENAGNSEEAMEWFKRGEEFSKSCPSTAARLYKHKSSLYYKLFYYNDALINADISADYFLQCEEYINYMYRLLDIAGINIALNDYEKAEAAFQRVNEYWEYADTQLKADYYWTRLNIGINLGDLQKIRKTIEDCNSEMDELAGLGSLQLKLAEAYLKLGENDEAWNILSSYNVEAEDEMTENSFLLIMSEYYEKTGDFENALNYFRKYNFIEAQKTKASLSSDMKFIEERYEGEIQSIKAKNREHTMLLSFFVFLAVCVLIIRYIKVALNNVRSELSETEFNFKQVEEEKNALMSIIKNSTILDKESLELINKRLLLLDKVLIGHLSQDPAVSKKAKYSIESLIADKDLFIQDTSRVFCASRPKFAGYLKEHELTEWEIGYCCLFLMGIYSKDLEPYFSVRTSNLINANIRKKLGMTANGQKLKSFLLEQFEEIEKSDPENDVKF